MDFEDMLKRAMEAGINNSEEEESKEDPSINRITSILEMGSLIKLAKASQNKMTEIIEDLTYDLNKLQSESSKDYIRSKGLTKIEKAAKQLAVLHTILTSAAITGSSVIRDDSSDDGTVIEKNLDMILRLICM